MSFSPEVIIKTNKESMELHLCIYYIYRTYTTLHCYCYTFIKDCDVISHNLIHITNHDDLILSFRGL